MMRSVTIHSDGFGGEGTVVLDEEGNAIKSVMSADIHIEANDMTRADITIAMAHVVVQAKVDHITAVCPMCGESADHECNGQMLSGGPGGWSGAVAPGATPALVPIPAPTVTITSGAPLSFCASINGTNHCKISPTISHDIHVDTDSGAIWTHVYKSLNPGVIHHL